MSHALATENENQEGKRIIPVRPFREIGALNYNIFKTLFTCYT